MRHFLRVYDALAAAPVVGLTRVELERATGLVSDEVLQALKALRRRRCLLDVTRTGRAAVVYLLRPGAVRPADLRGCYERTGAHRTLQLSLRLALLGRACVLPAYRAARPPSHTFAAGAARPGQ
jgi:hypothetical protein